MHFQLCPQMKSEKQDLQRLIDLLQHRRLPQMLPQNLAGEAASEASPNLLRDLQSHTLPSGWYFFVFPRAYIPLLCYYLT